MTALGDLHAADLLDMEPEDVSFGGAWLLQMLYGEEE